MNDNPETIVGSCTVEGIAGLIDNINRCKGEYNKCDIYIRHLNDLFYLL